MVFDGLFFFFNDTATTEIYTLSLHDALPIYRVGEAMIETKFGDFRLIAYESEVDGGDSHMALIRGDIEQATEPVLVRMHAHCLPGDVFGSVGCDCHATLEASLKTIAEEDRGALISLHQNSQGFTS